MDRIQRKRRESWMILANYFKKTAAVAAVLLISAGVAFSHVTIQPKQSTVGKTEKYVLRVPTEKFVPTVRVEVEFPAALTVSSFDAKPGWKIEEKRNPAGKLVGVILTGSIPTGESSEFT